MGSSQGHGRQRSWRVFGAIPAGFGAAVAQNLAKAPHQDGWLRVPGKQWERAYRFAITAMRDVLAMDRITDMTDVRVAFDQRMRDFEKTMPDPVRFKQQWSYAIGKAGTRTNRHPCNLSPIDDLRCRYLHCWGWGSDERVTNDLSMGAINVTNRNTKARSWMAVKGAAGRWVFLEEVDFSTEQEAVECARKHVNALLDAPKVKRSVKRKPQRNWIRPHVNHDDIRGGFASPNTQGKTQDDLLTAFGFRGIEFGNWVSQEERQQFVDASYDAFMDLTHLLGMPPSFASLAGTLGLAYGSRGKGLSKAAAHFEPDNWVLHFTKENGPGSMAHEFAHALDCWVANRFCANEPNPPRFASEKGAWYAIRGPAATTATAEALARWSAQVVNPYEGEPQWVKTAIFMDYSRTEPYWSKPIELFARAFEVLVFESFKAKNRHNDMLVYGVSEADKIIGEPFPYPVGPERRVACEHIAAVVRAFRAVFLSVHPLTPTSSV